MDAAIMERRLRGDGIIPTRNEVADFVAAQAAEIARLTRELEESRAALTGAALDVLAERKRQISVEGWTPEHDDRHDNAEMAHAAACYTICAAQEDGHTAPPPPAWPWDDSWWKPTTSRRDLVKSGALILAEIERLDRAALGEAG